MTFYNVITQKTPLYYDTQYARQFTPLLTKEEYGANLLVSQGFGTRSFAKIAMALAKKETEPVTEELIKELECFLPQRSQFTV